MIVNSIVLQKYNDFMIKQEITASKSHHQMMFIKKSHKNRQLSKRQCPEKYIIQGQTKQIGQIVTHRNVKTYPNQKINNTSIVTFKFSEPLVETYTKALTAIKVQKNRKRNVNKDVYLHTIRPLISNVNIQSLRIASCEVKRVQNEICHRRSVRKTQYDSLGTQLEVKGMTKNMQIPFNNSGLMPKTARSQRRSMFRMTAGSCRIRQPKPPIYDLAFQSNSIQILQLMRKPILRKDFFVFGMSDKGDNQQNKIQIYRDFLWKINYANGLFVATPINTDSGYKAFIGKGNNSSMVKGILRRRSWWTVVDSESEANFIWTQLKVNDFFKEQTNHKLCQLSENYSQSSLKKVQTININNELIDEYTNIFNFIDLKNWRQHYGKNIKTEEKIVQLTYIKRMPLLQKKLLQKIEDPFALKAQNHLKQNYFIGNKKALFYNLHKYYKYLKRNVFQIIPLTFHISKGMQDPKYQQFSDIYMKLQEQRKYNKQLRNVWIMKPGQNTNRGNGISVCFGLDDVLMRLKSKQKNKDGSPRTFILQKYIERPLLYQGRKFDIRHYALMTCFGGVMKGYWYQEGYVRTSSSIYNLKNSKDLYVHLTNDAIQKNGQNYGKFEKGNKISYEEIQRYIFKCSRKQQKGKAVSFKAQILPKMKDITLDCFRATYHLMDRHRKQHNFELFGLDFMIDQDYRPLLIEVNTNPCLQLSCSLLSSIIPQLVENTFRLCVDPLFPPPQNTPANKRNFFSSENPLKQNKFQLIFDQLLESESLRQNFGSSERINAQMGILQDDDVQFQNDGEQNWEQTNIE